MEDVEFLENIDTKTPEENLTLENQLDNFQLPPKVHNQQNCVTDKEEASNNEDGDAT